MRPPQFFVAALWYLRRVVALGLLAYLMSEFGFLFARLVQRLFRSTLQPHLSSWWSQGRSHNGLFNSTTWDMNRVPMSLVPSSRSWWSSSYGGRTRTTQATLDRYAVNARTLQDAWDRQFTPIAQWMMGCSVGLLRRPIMTLLARSLGTVQAPVVCILSSQTAELLVMAWIVAEVNHVVSCHIAAWWNRHIVLVHPSIVVAWSLVDETLEAWRMAVHRPWQAAKNRGHCHCAGPTCRLVLYVMPVMPFWYRAS